MPRIPGFKTELQRDRFQEAASRHVRTGPLARICGAKLRAANAICTQLALAGESRCIRHAGPDASRRFRDRQYARLKAGSVTPDEWARAEVRRARNALQWAWRKDPHLPGKTIDLGRDEAAFQDAVRALGGDAGSIYPALADWLRWRWQRTQRDRTEDGRWRQAVRDELPRRFAAAEEAVALADLGVKDWRTKTGRAVKAALRSGDVARAREVLAQMRMAEILSGEAARAAGASACTVPRPAPQPRPWKPRAGAEGWKRRLPDTPKRSPAPPQPPKPIGRPPRVPTTEDELLALSEVLRSATPSVRAMFGAISRHDDRVRFLRDLTALSRAPDDTGARVRWAGWVNALRGA